MSPDGRLAPAVRRALEPKGASCYRHCQEPVSTLRPRSALPGTWWVLACPSGVVSVTLYAESGESDPTARVAETLRGWSSPPALVLRKDLRRATRHGPELGREVERSGTPARGPVPVSAVYWRRYPFKGRDGKERRLLVCARRAHPHPVFFTGVPGEGSAACPVCARRSSA